MKTQLAYPYSPKRFEPCWVQPKLNGIRALYQNGQFYSRDEKLWNDNVVEHLVKTLARNIPSQMILDGEFYLHGWPLQKINGAIAVNRLSPRIDTTQIEYHVFDCPHPMSFLRRYQAMKSTIDFIHDNDSVKIVPITWCETEREGDWMYRTHLEQKYEGSIYRIGDAGYETKRTTKMLKRKGWQDDEFEIVDVIVGERKREGVLGSFVCKTKDGTLFNVGTGLGWTDLELARLYLERPVGKLLTVQYITLSESGIPQNPSARAIRDYE